MYPGLRQTNNFHQYQKGLDPRDLPPASQSQVHNPSGCMFPFPYLSSLSPLVLKCNVFYVPFLDAGVEQSAVLTAFAEAIWSGAKSFKIRRNFPKSLNRAAVQSRQSSTSLLSRFLPVMNWQASARCSRNLCYQGRLIQFSSAEAGFSLNGLRKTYAMFDFSL